METVSLYFHIPFCTKKCDYCHFYVLPNQSELKEELLRGLHLEWELNKESLRNKEIVSIYFGGGTPALFGPERISTVLQWIHSSQVISSSVEITLEANPETLSLEDLSLYRQAGVNRLSLGVQSLSAKLLKKLGRTHGPDQAIHAIQTASKAGIFNLSIDLMYDIPGQTLVEWNETLRQVIQLPITHLSLYNLTIEPHTLFFKQKELICKQLPDAESSLKMYEMATQMLSESGLVQYEISAFAKENLFSRHNIGYWTARPFLGFGPSAFSYWEGHRFSNVANLRKYVKQLEEGNCAIDFDEMLPLAERQRELFIVQLRLLTGVNLSTFQESHGVLPQSFLSKLKLFHQEGFLDLSDHHICLTRRGILFYDTIASELI